MRPLPANLGLVILLGALVGCLEETTGQPQELDPRILEQVADVDATGLDVDGPTVTLRGVLTAPADGAIDVDLTVADPTAPGGRRQLGKIPLDAPGEFEIPAPASQAGLTLAFFQDLAKDGPSQEDPYAQIVLDIGTEDVDQLDVNLVVGAYTRPTHSQAAPGEPGGGIPGQGGGQPPASTSTSTETSASASAETMGGGQPFDSADGVTVTISGSISSPLEAPVDLLVTLGDDAATQGTLVVGSPGPYRLCVPRGSGSVKILAVQDLASDGADATDPSAEQTVDVGSLDVDDVDFTLPLTPEASALLAAATISAAPTPAASSDEDALAVPAHVEHVAMPPGGVEALTAAQAGPFDDYEGKTVVVRGRIASDQDLAIDIDLRVPDQSVEGGERNLGKVLLGGPGSFAIQVPASLGDLRLEGFQDPDSDGPGPTDPWGAALVDVGDEDVDGVRMLLVAGARGTGKERVAVPHTEAKAGAAESVTLEDVDIPVDPAGVGPFANHLGAFVKVRGSVSSDDPAPVDIDVWVPDPIAPGGMRNQGKIVLLGPGKFSIRVPESLGKLVLEAYQDIDVDGPTQQDPFARVDLDVGATDTEGVDLTLALTGSRGEGSGGGGQAGPPPDSQQLPFADQTGPTVTLSGVVRGTHHQVVFIDLRVPDKTAPGGMRRAGQIHLVSPGIFQVAVPQGIGAIELEAFQDQDANGPDDDDPYGRLALEVGDKDLQAAIDLVDGGRALAAAAGAPGGGPQAGASSAETDAFPSYTGDRITISGTLTWAGKGQVDIDIFQTEPSAPGGRTIVGKLRLAPGPYQFTAPKGFGNLELEAFVDVDGD
ncbi:MAG: hypothetical protein GXP62_15785, partial [Oligoflexia bacterium]|nr:hypothetical protein [Oligoflexia bacterium]